LGGSLRRRKEKRRPMSSRFERSGKRSGGYGLRERGTGENTPGLKDAKTKPKFRQKSKRVVGKGRDKASKRQGKGSTAPGSGGSRPGNQLERKATRPREPKMPEIQGKIDKARGLRPGAHKEQLQYIL